MIKINLLPYRDILKRKYIFNHTLLAALTLAGALLVVLIAQIVITTRISAVEREIVRVETEIASNKKIVEEIEKLKYSNYICSFYSTRCFWETKNIFSSYNV